MNNSQIETINFFKKYGYAVEKLNDEADDKYFWWVNTKKAIQNYLRAISREKFYKT